MRQAEGEPFEPMRTEYAGSLKEPLNSGSRDLKPELKQRPHSTSSTTSSTAALNAGPAATAAAVRRDSNLPIHLLSATNEQKIKQVKQQLPFKLVHGSGGSGNNSSAAPSAGSSSNNNNNSTGSGGGGGSAAVGSSAGPQQMLPMKLSALSQSSGHHGNSHGGGGGQTRSVSGSHHHPALAKSVSSAHVTKSMNSRLTNTHSTPSLLSAKSRTLQASSSSSHGQTLLPMKLAEGCHQRAKSASPQIMPRRCSTSNMPATAAPSHGNQQNSHTAKSNEIKEEEVIYF